ARAAGAMEGRMLLLGSGIEGCLIPGSFMPGGGNPEPLAGNAEEEAVCCAEASVAASARTDPILQASQRFMTHYLAFDRISIHRGACPARETIARWQASP